ncbi:MAG: very short patch repair endonuclease [Fusobacteriaceae bacterium]|nr:very short patch repair endonuclease [Fusobacteriaceae bacterium]
MAIFQELGISGWRHGYQLKGHPDFVFLKKRIAVFVDGCFWQGHNCRNARPQENETFWRKKIGDNIARDRIITTLFESRGWIVIRIWECELKKITVKFLLKN